ncbi:MAG: hypothetical protein ACR5LF_08100 [Symbiopectobacterium sp.]
MPILLVKLGKTDFLNGTWRVTTDINPPHHWRTGQPALSTQRWSGTVRLTHGEGVTCRANVTAGLMQSGNLIINSRVKAHCSDGLKAHCSDGSRYQMPEIVCSQWSSGPAE